MQAEVVEPAEREIAALMWNFTSWSGARIARVRCRRQKLKAWMNESLLTHSLFFLSASLHLDTGPTQLLVLKI